MDYLHTKEQFPVTTIAWVWLSINCDKDVTCFSKLDDNKQKCVTNKFYLVEAKKYLRKTGLRVFYSPKPKLCRNTKNGNGHILWQHYWANWSEFVWDELHHPSQDQEHEVRYQGSVPILFGELLAKKITISMFFPFLVTLKDGRLRLFVGWWSRTTYRYNMEGVFEQFGQRNFGQT